MIKWIKDYFLKRKIRKEQIKLKNDLYYAQVYAIKSLAYWMNCEEKSDLVFQVQNTNIYVRLGRLDENNNE